MCGIDIETELKRHASSYRHRPWEDEFPDELRARVPLVSIIIPVHNGLEFTKPCLESIHANTPPAFELVVVDNASDDGTAEYLDGLDGIVIRNPINVGFPHSINQGLERARGKYVCLLNNDTEVLPGWLEPLIEDARDQDVACAGPLQTDGDGKVWHFGTVFYPEGHQFPRRPRHLKLGYPPDLASPLAKREFPAMNFACCLSRKEVFDEVGPLDAERYSFPGYYEDVDWMLRARELGYRAVFDPRSEIVHYGSKGVGDPDLKLKSEAARKRNVLRFVERWRDASPVLFQVADPTCELEGKDIATIKVREDGQPIDIPLLLKRKHAELETEKKFLAEARDSRLDEPGDPLVSVIIPTFNKAELLVERSIPSVLAQTYKRIEVVVVGDHCEDDTAERVAALNDDRVTFVNLPERGRYPAEPWSRWRVAGVVPLNEGIRLARGTWLATVDDDDAFAPDHVLSLLEHAMANDLEMVYGKVRWETWPGFFEDLGSFPPTHGGISRMSVIYHSMLSFLKYDIESWKLEEPADWNLWSRMKSCGVKIGFLDKIVGSHYLERSRFGL